MKSHNPLLVIGGVGSFAVALLHFVIIFIGADAYRFFGAGERMALDAANGSLAPTIVTFSIVVVFVLFGLYAFSGAGVVKKLWKLKPILLAITTIYLMRGFGFFIEILGIIYNHDVPVRHAVFSLTALIIGVFHLVGLIRGWKGLSVSGTEPAI